MLNEKQIEEIIKDTALLSGVKSEEALRKLKLKYMEEIDVVDDEGNILGTVPRGLAHRLGLRHSVVYASITNEEGVFLLQQRRDGRLDIAVGGHVQAGETDFVASLSREYVEELGILPINSFSPITVYNRDAPIKSSRPLERNRERRHLYAYVLSPEETTSLTNEFIDGRGTQEVAGLRWCTTEEVEEFIQSEKVADGLASSFSYIADYQGNN